MNIPDELANSIFRYLLTRPYGEVVGLIEGLKKATETVQAPKEPEVAEAK